jgi:Spy/CpxP family protein refolding chaperone
MLKVLTCVCFGVAVLVSLPAFAVDAPKGPSAMAAPDKAKTDEALAKYREAMQATRADIMAKGLTLSADQAAKFWPLYEQYQKEQNVIIDAQIEAVKKYAAQFEMLTDTDAVQYVKALLDRDAKMDALRVKWLPKFQTAVSGGTAARAIQLDRRISQIAQAELSSQVPLVH